VKLPGRGFTPRISGRPSRNVVELEVPKRLWIDSTRGGVIYKTTVTAGTNVACGESLGEARVNGGVLSLPSPVSARLIEIGKTRIVLAPDVEVGESGATVTEPLKFQYAKPEQVRDAIARGGMWPSFWSSATDGMPMLDGSEIAARCIVHFVNVEPFRARGRVFLTRDWEDIMAGIRFLPKLMEDYGKVEVILTEVHDPVAKKMYEELSGHAWTRLHAVPLRYPVGDPRIVAAALRRDDATLSRNSVIWSIDAQGIAQLGRLLGKGQPPSRRLVTIGGPGSIEAQHYSVPIGTSLSDFPNSDQFSDANKVLAGGLMRGIEVNPSEYSVQYDDDGFFLLPEATNRQTITFLRPGFDRSSVFPSFTGGLLGRADSHITATLRGEVRPCISCGMCERLCPVGLLPQVIHRYLHRDRIDDAVKVGLESCVDCNICTFVCPSKIELQRQFADARARVAEERRELEAAKGAEA
jgi:Na(+)-translocating NADH:ubiquinone oxidoreductase A subunit